MASPASRSEDKVCCRLGVRHHRPLIDLAQGIDQALDVRIGARHSIR